eukprot:4382310-Pleurochrysis_carterae.AAC.1
MYRLYATVRNLTTATVCYSGSTSMYFSNVVSNVWCTALLAVCASDPLVAADATPNLLDTAVARFLQPLRQWYQTTREANDLLGLRAAFDQAVDSKAGSRYFSPPEGERHVKASETNAKKGCKGGGISTLQDRNGIMSLKQCRACWPDQVVDENNLRCAGRGLCS